MIFVEVFYFSIEFSYFESVMKKSVRVMAHRCPSGPKDLWLFEATRPWPQRAPRVGSSLCSVFTRSLVCTGHEWPATDQERRQWGVLAQINLVRQEVQFTGVEPYVHSMPSPYMWTGLSWRTTRTWSLLLSASKRLITACGEKYKWLGQSSCGAFVKSVLGKRGINSQQV